MQTQLLGPFELSFESVDAVVQSGRCGVFALGHVDAAGVFRVERVGRDDKDLRQKLQTAIGSGNRFKFTYANSPEKAFLEECFIFHEFRPPRNFIHPDRLKGSGWTCPICQFA